jgi:Ala-tRNA(Pro) deacylase
MPVNRLKQYLDENKVRYVSVRHSQAFTAQEIAATAHIPGKELAKTVMVKLDDKLAMVVLPASRRIDMERLKQATQARHLELASESDFRSRFPECETGAMPPFGNLYDLDVFVEESLCDDDEIAFNAGSHTELIRMAYRDYERLVHPRHAEFACN